MVFRRLMHFNQLVFCQIQAVMFFSALQIYHRLRDNISCRFGSDVFRLFEQLCGKKIKMPLNNLGTIIGSVARGGMSVKFSKSRRCWFCCRRCWKQSLLEIATIDLHQQAISDDAFFFFAQPTFDIFTSAVAYRCYSAC